MGLDGPGSDKIEIFVEDLAVLFLILLRFQIERLIKTLGSVLTLFVVGDCVVDMNLWWIFVVGSGRLGSGEGSGVGFTLGGVIVAMSVMVVGDVLISTVVAGWVRCVG